MNNRWGKSQFASKLRLHQTDTEQLLWKRISNRQIGGVKFRRQEPIGKYIVDFVSLEKKIIIELDGRQHNTDIGKKKDVIRTVFLTEQGYTVIRFWDNEVLKNINGVLDQIYFIVRDPHPQSLSQRRGKEKEEVNI